MDTAGLQPVGWRKLSSLINTVCQGCETVWSSVKHQETLWNPEKQWKTVWNTRKQCKIPGNSVKQSETVTDTDTFGFQLLSQTLEFFTPPFATFSTSFFTPVGKSLHEQCSHCSHLFAALFGTDFRLCMGLQNIGGWGLLKGVSRPWE